MPEEYILLDFAGFNHDLARFTHYPSGDTCLAQPWMQHSDWVKKRDPFLAKYPDVTIRTKNGNLYTPA